MGNEAPEKSETRLSIGQIRAARALLGLTQSELAARADVAVATVKDYERGAVRPTPRVMAKISGAIVSAGVRPIARDEWGGEGVRMYK